MSNPREEMSLQKCFKFFPGLKNDHSRGEVLPKNALLFSEFLKNALFSRFFLRFSRSAFFLFAVLVFFQECFFFQADCTFLLSCSELPREIIFSLLLEVFIDQLLMPS